MILSSKDRAIKLFNKFNEVNKPTGSYITPFQIKQCALISVSFARENPLNTDGYNHYLDEVKKEIEKL